ILDEPTAALNDHDSDHLLNLMQELRDQGVTCIVISHKLGEVIRVADAVTVLRDGQVVETMYADRDEITEARIIKGMVGREMNSRFPPRAPKLGNEAFRLENWTVCHPVDPARKVVDSANLSVRRGEIVGLAGLMGAGRTEMAMSMFGRTYGGGVTGRVFLGGRAVPTRTVRQAVSHGIAYVSEDRKRHGLNLIQSVRENMTVAGLRQLARIGVIEAGAETAVAERLRRELAVKTHSVEVAVSKLSGGNQQKVALAKWVYTNPEVLILDEPTRGIDIGAKYEIYEIINQLAQAGKAVLVISSELPELLGICDRIYAISAGRITGDVPKGQATQEKLMTLMTLESKDQS
ncbi:MAG: sugar ABC transporter ATP-binding protein, partial [Bifidobacteriaceae bacterium]|nr:sugar ABC transporter ATP-binding protein [Bifidobacteriaceae bacterium]